MKIILTYKSKTKHLSVKNFIDTLYYIVSVIELKKQIVS